MTIERFNLAGAPLTVSTQKRGVVIVMRATPEQLTEINRRMGKGQLCSALDQAGAAILRAAATVAERRNRPEVTA